LSSKRGALLLALALWPIHLDGWGSKIHSGIVHAALGAIPPDDGLLERFGDELWRLREYVQMGDWNNNFVTVNEQWSIRGETLEQGGLQFFANDYLLFPDMPRTFQHLVPDVKVAYRPYFLRALQAMRTESPDNAARWIGSLLHFVTDTGSPPHAIGVLGDAHTKMENWLDPSLIDLTKYSPRMLGATPQEAVDALQARMDGLIAFSAARAHEMLPAAKSGDRAAIEPQALECAAETSRVTADILHTLLRLSAAGTEVGAILIADVQAPAIPGMDNVPAKLVILDTPYSTLSVEQLPTFGSYHGRFVLHGIPPGTCKVAVERPGAATFTLSIVLKSGQTLRQTWQLAPSSPSGNLLRNPNMELHWSSHDAPDHWRFDAPRKQWVSENVPVTAGKVYRVGGDAGPDAPPVELQWMSQSWQAMNAPAMEVKGPSQVTVPDKAIYVRFAIKQVKDPTGSWRNLYLTP
jgi:hypothetical protein